MDATENRVAQGGVRRLSLDVLWNRSRGHPARLGLAEELPPEGRIAGKVAHGSQTPEAPTPRPAMLARSSVGRHACP
jgi:hypothetical protein